MVKCKICGKDLKNPLSTSHINSKFHRNALGSTQLVESKKSTQRKRISQPLSLNIQVPTGFSELLLFQAIKHLKIPTYDNILKFCSSFGSKSEEIIRSLIKKLNEGDIKMNQSIDPRLQEIYQVIFQNPDFNYPITIKVIDAISKFKKQCFNNPLDVVSYFKALESEYSGFALVSSSQMGEPEDLITFKRIFPNCIKFQLHNRWGK